MSVKRAIPWLLGGALLAGGLTLWLLAARAQAGLRDWAVRASHGEIVPGAIQGRIGGRLTLRDVTLNLVRDQPEPRPVAQVGEAVGELDWSRYATTKKVWPKTVTVRDFTLDLLPGDDELFVLPLFSYADDEWDGLPDEEDEATSEKPEWPPLAHEPREMAIALEGGTLRLVGPASRHATDPLLIEGVEARARYKEKRLFEIERFGGVWAGAPLTISGTYDYSRHRRFEAAVGLAQLPFGELVRVLGLAGVEEQDIAGEVSLTAQLQGDREAFTGEGELSAPLLEVADVQLTDVVLPLTYASGQLVLGDLSQAKLWGGTLTLGGSWDMALGGGASSGSQGSLHLTLHDIDLGQYLEARALPRFGYSGRLEGSADFTLTTPDTWTLPLQLRSTNTTLLSPFQPELWEQAGEPGFAPTPAQLEPLRRLDLEGTLTPEGLAIDEFLALANDFTLRMHGPIGVDHALDLAGTLTVQKQRLESIAEFGKYAKFLPADDMGFVTLSFGLGGTLEEPELRYQLERNAESLMTEALKGWAEDVEEAL